jgi:adenine-specific DNA methylase
MKVFYVSYDARGNVDSENLRNRLEELGGRNVLKSV